MPSDWEGGVIASKKILLNIAPKQVDFDPDGDGDFDEVTYRLTETLNGYSR